MNKNIFDRRGEGSSSVVAIVAILIIVILAVYFLFFRGGASSSPDDVNVNLPDTVNVTQDAVPAADGGAAPEGSR